MGRRNRRIVKETSSEDHRHSNKGNKMKISDNGLDIIKDFEGYGTKLPDGGCKAYRTYLGNGK